CGHRRGYGADRGLGYACPLGQTMVRKACTALLDDRGRVSRGPRSGTRAPAAGSAVEPLISGVLLVAIARGMEQPGGQLRDRNLRDCGWLAGLYPRRRNGSP